MGKNRNKHRNLVPNIYRLRIEEVAYIVDDKHIKCIIKYINPITLNLQNSIGVANCNPNDTFDEVTGKRIAESRAKTKAFKIAKNVWNCIAKGLTEKANIANTMAKNCAAMEEIESNHVKELSE